MTQRTVSEVWSGTSVETPSVRELLGKIWQTFMVWQQRASERVALRSMDDRALKDIGITRADVWRECRKPFWQE